MVDLAVKTEHQCWLPKCLFTLLLNMELNVHIKKCTLDIKKRKKKGMRLVQNSVSLLFTV